MEDDLSDHELHLFHQTLQALQVTTLVDIIRVSSFNCKAATLSPYSWPLRKTTITREHKDVWQPVLCRIASHTRILYSPLGQWLVAPNKMLPFHKSDRGLIHIQSPEVWHLHLQVTQTSQRRTRNHSEAYQSEFEVVQPFEGKRWVTDASINTTTGLITVPTVVQIKLLKCLHCPQDVL